MDRYPADSLIMEYGTATNGLRVMHINDLTNKKQNPLPEPFSHSHLLPPPKYK